jgi:phytoene dehydrogenase-like protein
LEREDQLGGRVRTDYVDRFRLDRGFQVLQTAYPEAMSQLDYGSLNLKNYLPGALILKNSRFYRFIDPWRRPWDGLISGIRSGIGTFADRIRIAKLRSRCRSGKIAELFDLPDQSTREYLASMGFSDDMISSFFRPFFGGVFLERQLATSSRMMMFVFRMFSEGDAAIPAEGMQAIPNQMASRLPQESLRRGCQVSRISSSRVQLENGESLMASRVVLATPDHVTARLLNHEPPPNFRRVVCLYFSAHQAPIAEPILVLNGDSEGPINNLSVPSVVSASYAPSGRHLISISVVDEKYVEKEDLVESVRKQCGSWFGEQVQDWQLLKKYDIQHALPDQTAGRNIRTGHAISRDGIIICGDHVGHGSIQSALESGRHAAEMVLEN